MIEAPLSLQDSLQLPADHMAACKAAGTPTQGNAAGNAVDFYDLEGENTSVAPLPAGFTARGVVALVFSCVAAFMGLGFIVWYGVAPLGESEMAAAQSRISQAGMTS